MSTNNEPNASNQSGSSGTGCFLGFGGLALLGVILINGMIARNNQAILQNNLQIQENSRRMQENERERQRLTNRPRGW